MCNRALLPFFLAATLTAPGQVVPFGALRVAVEVPAKTQLCFGTLTLSAAEVRFESDQRGGLDELLFSIPVKDVEEVEVAGFRERFLSLKIRQNTDFVKAYAFLFAEGHQAPTTNALNVNFELGPKEDLRAALRTASELKSQVGEAQVSTKDTPTKGDQPLRAALMPPTIGSGSEISSRFPNAAPTLDHKALPELFRQEARYLEKLRGLSALMVTSFSGTPGELVFFDDSFGYRSERQNPRIDATKSQFLEDGYLKFRLQNSWIQNVVFKPVIGNHSVVVIVVHIDKNSPFMVDSRSLLTDTGKDDEIVFLVSTSGQYQVANYFRTKVKGTF